MASPGQGQAARRVGHIVSHTHWDREWRYPIWETRLQLVAFMDELLDVLERGDYPGFLLDGQCSPVLDYLEIRPENRERIRALVSAGKLNVGPWYTLPDEYPVDGEAMVRNLLWGRRMADDLGGVTNLGYTPFGWGQTAQLPQIYGGFGMQVAFIGKRVSKTRAPNSEFLWRAPDGTELLATRFGEWGRQNLYFFIHLSALFGTPHLEQGWHYDWSRGGIAFHRADDEQYEQDHFRLDAPTNWHPEYITPEVLDRVWQSTDESVLAHDRLMMNGCDYTASQPMFAQMLERMREVDTDPNRDWNHTTLPDFAALMQEKIDRDKLPVVHGELRDGPAGEVTGNALTTRLYLKRLNKRAQNMLIRFAEPLTSAVTMLGTEYPAPFIHAAWKHLLEAHPHDSINGVTQDKTVDDVANRLQQVIDISQSLGNRAMRELVRRIDLTGFADDDVLLVAFNPLPHARREVVSAWINMPAEREDYPFWPRDPDDLVIADADGQLMDTQCMGHSEQMYCVAELHTRAFPFKCDRFLVYFDTGEVPAGGYKVFRVARRTDTQPQRWAGSLDRTDTLLTAPNVIENEHLRLVMNPNGTFDLTDKVNGRTFAGLNYYEDRGEHGDYWSNLRPMFDEVHTSLGAQARIWSEQTGPLTATLLSEITMRIPARSRKDQQRRGDELADLTITTAVTLRAGSQQVDVDVKFENRHEDHYLRAMFPTGLSGATHADADGHFIVDRRPIRPQGPGPDTVWPDMGTLPMNNFVSISDDTCGVAFLTDSLTEYEVSDSPERVVALSLLRSVKNWLCTEMRCSSEFPSQKGGQCFGHHHICYAIRPHAGTWHDAGIGLEAERFNVPPRLVQTRTSPGDLPAGAGTLYGLDNLHLRLSGFKRAEDRDSFIFRVYNPTADAQRGCLRLAVGIRNAWRTDLNEQRIEEMTRAEDGAVALVAGPYAIVTVEIETPVAASAT